MTAVTDPRSTAATPLNANPVQGPALPAVSTIEPGPAKLPRREPRRTAHPSAPRPATILLKTELRNTEH